MAHHLGVSPQCIDSYANGRAHPQIMKFCLDSGIHLRISPGWIRLHIIGRNKIH